MNAPPLYIEFLGTGTSAGVPMIACNCAVCSSTNKKDKRLRSSILVRSESTTLVVDTTPDFRYQMLRAGIQRLDAVIFTHPHKDHLAGLDDIRAFNYFMKKPMPLFVNDITAAAIQREYSYAFSEEKYPGVPQINLQYINDLDSFMVGDIPVLPIAVMHSKMTVLGFRFGDFTYITDANFIDEVEKEKIKGSKVLVLNALRKEDHVSHFTLAQAVALGEELAIPKVYFTHISHQLGLHNSINDELPVNMQLAFDQLHFCL
ncbi:MAG: MBL fold metallo-hydrolase [Chitinophagaceae bacterium]|nr:MBL fold metallo-hydrolase [Chitinophagaceae bacterium]